jgi:dihydrodipicolinate synthase/N-acetylneuraminate lyase
MQDFPLPPSWVREALIDGGVIPAHPLALDRARRFDERRQRGLTRYYHACGAIGVAVGVHTTQFEIRDPQIGLYGPVLRAAAETVIECDEAADRRTVLIAGIAGETTHAVAEARLARSLGYHAGLLSLGAMRAATLESTLAHVRAVAGEIPIVGFYLQPAVGGMHLPYEFWRRLCELENLVAIKIAPFNRYQTLDVAAAVADAGRAGDVALYTGNDDAIVADLVTPLDVAASPERLRIVGGLLGQWACWTERAVALHRECRAATAAGSIPADLLERGAQLTRLNAAVFDVENSYRGSIAGVNEVLRRAGLLETSLCLDPHADLSPGQAAAIDAAARRFPWLTDDEFVRANSARWVDA